MSCIGNTEKAQGKSYPLCPFCYNQPPQFVHEADLVNRNSTHDSISMHHGLQVEEGVITVFKGLDISADEASNISSSPSDYSSRELSLQAVTTSSSRAAVVAAMPDIEDHGGGVMIKRRFKEGEWFSDLLGLHPGFCFPCIQSLPYIIIHALIHTKPTIQSLPCSDSYPSML